MKYTLKELLIQSNAVMIWEVYNVTSKREIVYSNLPTFCLASKSLRTTKRMPSYQIH